MNPSVLKFKFTLYFVFLILAITNITYGQTDKDIFTTNSITWYGLDFSKAKMVGRFTNFMNAGEKSSESIKNTYFEAWNKVICTEENKYSLKETFHVDNAIIDLDTVTKRNAKVDENTLMSPDPAINELRLRQIEEIIQNYLSNKNGIGVLFIVEKFDKYEDLGTVDLVYFDESNGKILLSKRMFGKSGGFGIRNYWIKTIYNIMEDIGRAKWEKWQKEAKKEARKKAKKKN